MRVILLYVVEEGGLFGAQRGTNERSGLGLPYGGGNPARVILATGEVASCIVEGRRVPFQLPNIHKSRSPQRNPALGPESPRMRLLGNPRPPGVTSHIAPVQYLTCSTVRTGAISELDK